MTIYNSQKIYLAPNIQFIRQKENLSQEKLATKFGITKQAVGHWETGKNKPDLDSLIELAAYFKISLDDLVFTDLSSTYNTDQLALEKTMKSSLEKLEELRKILLKGSKKRLRK